MENNFMDNMVRDAIGEYEMAFNPADWDAMEAQLESDTRVRRKLYVAKGVEVCLMALAIWTTLQFVSLDNAANYQAPTTQQETLSPQPTQNNETIVPFQEQEQEQEQENENTEHQNATTPNNQQQPKQLPPEFDGVPIANQLMNTSSEFEISVPQVSEEHTTNHQSKEENQYKGLSPSIEKKSFFNTKQSIPIASLEPELFDVKNDIMLFPVHAQVRYSSRKKASATRIGGLGATDLVSINTPNNVLVQKKSHQFSLSGGVVADRKLWDKIKLETGALFAIRKHSEREIDFYLSQNGPSSGTAIQRREVKTAALEVPVHLLYDVYEKDKNKVYAIGGVSNHFALSFDSQLESYDVYGDVQTVQLPTDRIAADTGLLNRLEGEAVDLPSNHYVSINGGVGYERELTDKYSVFVQGVYKKGFGQLGRHNDNISNLSLATGLKKKI